MKLLREYRLFIIIAAIIFLLLLIMEMVNGRFKAMDFEVYYLAAKAYRTGTDVYGVVFGQSGVGYYKYSPSVLLLYVPATLLSFKVAAVINYFVLATASISYIIVGCRLVERNFYFGKGVALKPLLFLTFLLSITFLNRDLVLGNTNAVLLLVILYALTLLEKGKSTPAGLLFAIAITFKPYLIIITLPLLAHKKYKTLIATSISGIIIALFPILLSGFVKGINLYVQWYEEMMKHGDYIISSFTFDSLVKQYLAPNLTSNLGFYFLAFAALVYLSIKFVPLLLGGDLKINQMNFLLETFTILALVPNLFNTDTQQLMYGIPIVIFLLAYLNTHQKWSIILPFVIVFFFFAVDQPDLFGRPLAKKIYELGIAGICNLLLILAAWILFYFDKDSFREKYSF
jgi:hypothetical protein